MTTRTFLAGTLCPLLLACPHVDGLDAGSRDANDTDAGADGGAEMDGGSREDGGPEEVDGGPTDAGVGEGEGECIDLFGLTDLVDDAGVIHYEHCDSPYFGSCNDGSCATTDAARQLVDVILDVAQARGYGDRIEIVQAFEDPPLWAIADTVVIADWARARVFVQGYLDDGGQVIRETVEAELPATVPAILPSYSDVQARLRECSPDIIPELCTLGVSCPQTFSAVLEGSGGFGTPDCVGATLKLWDPCTLDAGPAEVTCYPGGAPCCE